MIDHPSDFSSRGSAIFDQLYACRGVIRNLLLRPKHTVDFLLAHLMINCFQSNGCTALRRLDRMLLQVLAGEDVGEGAIVSPCCSQILSFRFKVVD